MKIPVINYNWVINMGFDYELIGSRIKKAREKKGFTQEQLAEKISLSSVHISNIERGRTKPSLDSLSDLCTILEQPAGYILNGAEQSSGQYFNEEIYTMLEHCSPEQKKLIAKMVRVISETSESI